GSHINFRHNWARADTGMPSMIKTTKTNSPSHTIIEAIHGSSVIYTTIKKLRPK
ncbi:hypothetical protein CLU79DRAFT_681668, partial [Phycomyces nitens]